MTIIHTERRGNAVGYIERAKYRFVGTFDDWGHPVVALFAATDDQLFRLRDARIMFRLSEGLIEKDARRLADQFNAVFEDVQMQRIEGPPEPPGGSRKSNVVPIRRAA